MPWVWTGTPKGFGKGGWGKGSWKGGKGGYRKPQGLPEDFTPNTTKLYTGTVSAYYKFQGYGFITPDIPGELPNDKVFVFWEHLVTTDRYPSLLKDMKVQFKVKVAEKQGVQTLQASEVAMPGGMSISVQGESDAKKSFVGGQAMRYTGILKFFLPKPGYGYIKIDPGFQYDHEGVPAELRVETSEMNSGGANPGYMEDVKVEFGIWVNAKGAFKGYNVTQPDGKPFDPAPPTE